MTRMDPRSPSVVWASSDATGDNIRVSSLLTIGRLIAVGINFLVHVLIVRYLAQADYGAFAYATSAVALGSTIAVFGMNNTLLRFVPIYEERGDLSRAFGALAVGLGTIGLLAIGIVLAFYLSQGLLVDLIVDNGLALPVLMIMVLRLPVQAFDRALVGLFAIFGSARHIIWRRYIVAPLLDLTVVIIVIVGGHDVLFLAAAMVGVAMLGLATYTRILIQLMRRRGLFEHLRLSNLRFPVREMLSFSLPLLVTDVVYLLRVSVIVILLGGMTGVAEVALFSAVVPIANQNALVLESFRLLFMPTAARLYEREDGPGINDLYWQAAIWVVIATLPILLVSVSLARPVTVFLFGDPYAQSATVLAILGIGHFVNAAFGNNGPTLRVFGRVRYLVTVDLLTGAVGVAATVPLIGMWGATGAAVGVTLMLVVQNALYQIGLARSTSVTGFAPRYLRVYLGIPVAASAVFITQIIVNPPLWFGLGLVLVVSLGFFILNRRFLRLGEVFPELRRLPLARSILD